MRPHRLTVQDGAHAAQPGSGVDDPGREDAVGHDLPLRVDVAEEGVESRGPLHEPAPQTCPLLPQHDARDEIDGEEAAARPSVHYEWSEPNAAYPRG